MEYLVSITALEVAAQVVQPEFAVEVSIGGTGATGPQGPQGVQGPEGPQGPKGDKGDQGDQGPQGIQGIQGIQGVQGDKGDKGDTGDTGPQGIQGIQGNPGTNGTDGKSVLNGAADPTTQGVDGDFYINTTTDTLFGPKTGGVWGAGISLIGPAGATGAAGSTGATGATGPQGPAGADGTNGTNGIDGKTVLNGAVNPTTEGTNGDFYINTTTNTLFGPKAGGVWPAGVSLVGPAGATGATGANGTNGTNGADGKTVLNGVVNPTTEGINGDFYINTATNFLFGPKAAGVWPAGVSLVGPTGATGATGAAGPNLVNGSTGTTFTGILKGDGANVGAVTYGTDGQVLTMVAGAPAFAPPGGGYTFYDQTALFISSTVARTLMSTFVIPANTITATGQGLDFWWLGAIVNNTGANTTFTFSIDINGATVYSDSSGNVATGAAAPRLLQFMSRLIRSGTTKLGVNGLLLLGSAGAVTTGPMVGDFGAASLRNAPIATTGNANNITVDFTTTITVDVYITLGSSSALHGAYYYSTNVKE